MLSQAGDDSYGDFVGVLSARVHLFCDRAVAFCVARAGVQKDNKIGFKRNNTIDYFARQQG